VNAEVGEDRFNDRQPLLIDLAILRSRSFQSSVW
jgi:hypothetical protein